MTTSSTPDTPRDDTLATEVFDEAPSPTVATATATATGPVPAAAAAPPEQTYLRGPAPFAITLGLLGLVVAGATFLTEVTDVSLPWTDLGLRGSRPRD
jgi:hypothetical protein